MHEHPFSIERWVERCICSSYRQRDSKKCVASKEGDAELSQTCLVALSLSWLTLEMITCSERRSLLSFEWTLTRPKNSLRQNIVFSYSEIIPVSFSLFLSLFLYFSFLCYVMLCYLFCYYKFLQKLFSIYFSFYYLLVLLLFS